jgi:hypothetical protein
VAKLTADRLHVWERGARDAEEIVARGRPGERIAAGGHWNGWRGLRHQLAVRGLAVIAVGQRFYLAPAAAVPRVPLLRQLAAAAKEDPAGRAALADFIDEAFDPPSAGMKAVLVRTFVRACADSPGSHAAVPGGTVDAGPRPAEVMKPAAVNAAAVHDLPRRVAKLSKLQRSVLRLARDYATRNLVPVEWGGGRYQSPVDGAPVKLMRAEGKTRSHAAARSRAIRRLEARGLLRVRRVKGRAVVITLTPDGQRVVRDC